MSEEDFRLVDAILKNSGQQLEGRLPSVLLHGDIYRNHLLWDAGHQQLGIIDFSDMTLGDPAFDFAELFEYGKEFVEEVYFYYVSPKDSTFLERAWHYQFWVGVYMMTDYFGN